MSTQDTPVIDTKAVSSEAPKEKDVALFTDDKAQTPPATEEAIKETKAEGEKPAVEAPETGTETTQEVGGDPATEVPAVEEEVKYELKLGEKSELSKKDIEEVEAFAKENKLSKESAQKLLDSREANYAQFKSAQTEMLKERQVKWLEEVKTDKEIGGVNFDKSIALAKMPIAKYASPSFKKMLDDSGLGNHPEVIKLFARIGKSMQDDTIVDAPKSAASKAEKPVYEYLYE